jgi:cytochrome P450
MSESTDVERPTADWRPADESLGDSLRCPARITENARLRDECPVAFSDLFGGFYTLSRYEDVVDAARDYKRFRSGRPFVSMPGLDGIIPGSLNPPEHGRYRRMLNKYFSQEAMGKLEPVVADFLDELLPPILEQGSTDIVPALCQPLPVRALSALMNLPDAACGELIAQIAGFDAVDWDPDKVNEVIFSVFSAHIAKVVAERREQPLDPDLDLLSGAMAMEIDGEPLSEKQVISIGVSMIGAGHVTTADALSTAIHRLATTPELQARLRRDPELIPQAVEEFLRLEGPLGDLGRETTVDVELHGTTIPAGSIVSLNYAAANGDGRAFDHPEACIVDRMPNKHVDFGHGPHKCAGAPLARLEMRMALSELLTRTRDIELDGRAEPVKGLLHNAFSSLPVRISV